MILNNYIIGSEMKYSMEIWNFMTGYKYVIKLNENINNIELMKLLSKSIKRKINNMIFFYDLKTTGGNYANNKLDIIDRYFEEYTTKIIPSSGLLKPIMVPFIPFDVVKTTGITKDMIDETADKYETFIKEIKQIFDLYEMPIFISNVDNKILINKNIFNMEKCRVLDAKMIIKMFIENKDIASKDIKDIYEYFFKILPKTNRAELETKVIIDIFRYLNITNNMIIKMVNL